MIGTVIGTVSGVPQHGASLASTGEMTRRAPYRKRDVVREDILQAAEELFATRSPSEVSLREIADCGGFQHSLITRHFGTKDELIAQVVERTLDAYVEAVRGADDAVDGFVRGMEHMSAHPASYQAMARALIDDARNAPDGDLLAGFAIHRDQLAQVRGERDDGVELEVLTIALMAFTSGWAFMEDRWMRAGGFDDADRTRIRDQVARLLQLLVERS